MPKPPVSDENPLLEEPLLEAMGLSVVVLDPDCRIVRMNARAETLTQQTSAEVTGRLCGEVLRASPCGPRCPVAMVKGGVEDACSGPMVIQDSDGQSIAVEVTASARRDKKGRPIGAVQVLRRLGEPSFVPLPLRKVNQEIAALREALERSGGSISEAARLLGMHRTTLWRKLRRYRLGPAGQSR